MPPCKISSVFTALSAALILAGSRNAGAQNLVANGDFSKGNADFLYGYKYVEPVADALIPASVFTVARNTHRPFLLNSAGARMFDYFDHTTGDEKGAFLLVNGAGEPGQMVWGQRITVEPNTNYYFSTWVSTWTPNEVSPAQLQFRINGKLIGPVFTAPEAPGLWGVFEAVWNSGNNSLADIYVINQNTQEYGNDFALDDIVFQRTSLPILNGRRLRRTFYPAKPVTPTKPIAAPR